MALNVASGREAKTDCVYEAKGPLLTRLSHPHTEGSPILQVFLMDHNLMNVNVWLMRHAVGPATLPTY